MSNVQATMKSGQELVMSLADQRKFNVGQISYLGRELMEKPRLEENFEKILKVDQNICIIDDMTSGDLCKSYDEHYDKVKSHVSNLVDVTRNILKIEDDYRKKEEELLGPERKERLASKQNFDRNMSIKLEKLSENLLSEELELERKYLKFEENLRNK